MNPLWNGFFRLPNDRCTRATFDLFRELGCLRDGNGSDQLGMNEVGRLDVDKMMTRALDCLAAVCEAQRLRVMFKKLLQLATLDFAPMSSEQQAARNKVFVTALKAFAAGLTHADDDQDDLGKPMERKLLCAFPDSSKLADGRGWLPLHWAVVAGEDEESDVTEADVRRVHESDPANLQKHHLDPVTVTDAEGAAGKFGYTPAHLLCGMEMTERNMSLVRYFSSSDYWAFTINAVDNSESNGVSALHVACWNRKRTEELLRLLVQLNPLQMKSLTSDGGPLGLLCQFSGDLDDRLLGCLLEADSSVEVVHDAIYRCFTRRGMFKDRVRIVAKLLKVNPEAAQHKDEDGRNLAHLICRFSDRIPAGDSVKILKLLLIYHKDALKEADYDGQLPAHAAATFGPVQLLDFVLGEYPEASAVVDSSSHNLLHLAVMFGRRRVAKARLLCARYPAMLLQRDSDGYTPLLITSRSAIKGALVWVLCKAGGREAACAATVNPTDGQHRFDGWLPLHELLAWRYSTMTADPLSPWADTIRLLLRLYPEAAGTEAGVDDEEDDDEPQSFKYKTTPYQLAVFRKLPAYYLRLLLRAAPHLDPAELRRLNWEERRMAMYVASAVAAKKPTSLFANKDLVRHVVSFL